MDEQMQSRGVELIAEERRRQIAEEGYDADHDHAHGSGELGRAAAAYAMVNAWYGGERKVHPLALWPWDHDSWKPGVRKEDLLRNLVKAGALVAAAIDCFLEEGE